MRALREVATHRVITRTLFVALALMVCLLTASPVQAADTLRLKTPGVLTTQGVSRVEVAPGSLIVPPAEVARLEQEYAELQEARTRLTAENAKLRDLTEEGPMHTLKVAGLGLLVGVAVGFVAGWAL